MMRTRQHESVALLLISAALLVVACASSGTATPSTSRAPLSGPYSYTPAARTSQQPLVFGDMQVPDTLNPLFADMPIDFALDNALWAAPVFFDQQFHVHPDQLTEVPLPQNGDVQDSGKTIIMRLRHDLSWSDGQPITSADFRYWWQLDQNPDTGAITMSGYDEIASIDTPDAYTVVLHMKRPFGPYLSYLPYAAPQHAWGKLSAIALQNTPSIFAAPAVTDGPYTLTGSITGPSITMLPNRYYRSSTFHGPFAPRLVYRVYPSNNALIQAMQRAQVDASEGYTENDLPLLRAQRSAIHVVEVSAAAYEHVDLNLSHPILQDTRVRRAIQSAINVCGMLAAVVHDTRCSRQVSQVELPPSFAYDAAIQPARYDPAQARALLAQAGWRPNAQGALVKSGRALVLQLVTTDDPTRVALARYIQRDLQAVGIQVRISIYALGAFFGVYTKGGILATGAYDLALFTYVNGPDPDEDYNVFDSSQIPSASNPYGGNYGRVSDPLIDQALTNGRFTVSFAARVAAYHQFLERLAAQIYTIPLYTEVNIMAASPRVRNILPGANLYDNTWNIADWWMGT